MNIFITGGLGILGNSILKKLSNKKNKLIVYDRAKNFQRFNRIKKKGDGVCSREFD